MISGNTGTVPTQNKSHLHIKKCFTNIEFLTVSYISPPNISNYCMEIVASKINVVLTAHTDKATNNTEVLYNYIQEPEMFVQKKFLQFCEWSNKSQNIRHSFYAIHLVHFQGFNMQLNYLKGGY